MTEMLMFRADLENVPGPPRDPLPKSRPIYFLEQNYYFSNQHDFFGAPEAEGRRGPEAGPLGRALRPTAEGRRGPEAVGPLGRALRPSACKAAGP